MYDIIIVGAGIAGSTAARVLAEKGKKILVIDKRNHIGGNCYDTKDDAGILIHPYGPHIFHTNNEAVYKFLSNYTKWYSFRHKVVANVHGRLMPVPFNLHTLEQAFPDDAQSMKKKLIDQYGMDTKVPILDLINQSDEDLKRVGNYVYENIYVHYTMKQWGKKPEEIDPEVTKRVPVSISYEDGYFADKYQGVPKDGYTKMFEHLLNHENITLQLNTEASNVITIKDKGIYTEGKLYSGQVIFTGPLDEFFDCKYGRLPYRTLQFSFEHYEADDYQGHSVVNYTVDQDFTRITEYKYLTGQQCGGTTISKEYPHAYEGTEGQIPYYAINNPENDDLYKRYKKEVHDVNGFYLLGRLAEYKYYNMDKMTEEAIALAEKIG